MSADIEKEIIDPEDGLQRLIKLVPKGKQEEASKLVAIVQEQITSFEGPIPPPEQFAQYESILPGSAERIMKMAETQQAHRITIEQSIVKDNLKINRRGQIFGFVALIMMLALAVFFVYNQMIGWAGTVGTVTIVSIVGLFITGKLVINNDVKESGK